MWDLPGPGLEPVSLALAGGFLTTAPPGKSYRQTSWKNSPHTLSLHWRDSQSHSNAFQDGFSLLPSHETILAETTTSLLTTRFLVSHFPYLIFFAWKALLHVGSEGVVIPRDAIHVSPPTCSLCGACSVEQVSRAETRGITIWGRLRLFLPFFTRCNCPPSSPNDTSEKSLKSSASSAFPPLALDQAVLISSPEHLIFLLIFSL